FGVILYELITGRQTFSGETVSDMLASVLKTDPDWSKLPADTPASVRRLLRRCLQRDRRKRLQDIGDARLEFEEPAEPATAATAQAPARKSKPWPWIAAGVFAALAGGAGYLLRTPPEAPAVRFDIYPPAGEIFSALAAVSPDGRSVALRTL